LQSDDVIELYWHNSFPPQMYREIVFVKIQYCI